MISRTTLLALGWVLLANWSAGAAAETTIAGYSAEQANQFGERIIGGTIITGFEWRGDAEVRVTVEAGPIRLGRFPDGMDDKVQRLVDLFRQAGLNVEGSDSIRTNLWAKTLYNCWCRSSYPC